MNFTLTVSMDDDAMTRYPVASLRDVFDQVRTRLDRDGRPKVGWSMKLRDDNGNTIGKAEVTE